MKPTVHFVSDGHGGMARYVEQLVAAQIALGRSRVVVFGPSALQLPADVSVRPYAPVSRPHALNHWKFMLAVARGRRAKTHAEDALHHTHSLTIGRPDVHTFHGFYTRDWLTKGPSRSQVAWRLASRVHFELLRRVERAALCRARAVVFVSSDDVRYAQTCLRLARPDPVHVIGPGVDSSLYSPILRENRDRERRRQFPSVPPDSRWLLFAGYDLKGKGLFRLIPELPRVERRLGKDPVYELLVFGGTPTEKEAARVLADASGARIHLFADDSQLVSAFALSDIFLMDSMSEGFPLVLLEAMASGCVPIVTRFGGVRDTIHDGANGVVGESAADLAAAALTTRETALAAMSERAHRDACRRSWRTVAEEYEAVYRAL